MWIIATALLMHINTNDDLEKKNTVYGLMVLYAAFPK